jgi:hypothetical protein
MGDPRVPPDDDADEFLRETLSVLITVYEKHRGISAYEPIRRVLRQIQDSDDRTRTPNEAAEAWLRRRLSELGG